LSSNRSILNIRYTPVGAGAAQKAGRLTNYVQNRDNEREDGQVNDPESFARFSLET
jgi:hypothetical protein